MNYDERQKNAKAANKNVIDKNLVENINSDTFSSIFLVSLLCGLSDAMPETFMVNLEDPNDIKIVGVQNDKTFSAGGCIFVKDGVNTLFDSPANVGSSCNSLFLLPQMDDVLSPLLFNTILKPICSPEDLVSSWMRELYMQNQRYQSLITSGFNGLDLDNLQLPVKLPSDAVVSIYKKLVAIREVVSEGNVLTHHDLFAHFYPNQATYYSEKRILSKSMPIAGMIHSLMEPIRNKDITTEFISNKNKGPSILSMEALSLEFVSSIDFRRIQNIPAPEDPRRPNICSIIADNLAFLPLLQLRGISEVQLREMFLTSSTKSNTKEVVVVEIEDSEVMRIKECVDINSLLAKHGAHLTFLPAASIL